MKLAKNLFKGFFSNIALIPGPGHIELNMRRLLLKFLWTPFLLNIVKQLGFRTDKAQLVVKNGVDYHHTHQILSCSLFALLAELLLPHVHECLQNQILPTNEGYQKWVTAISNICLFITLLSLTSWHFIYTKKPLARMIR